MMKHHDATVSVLPLPPSALPQHPRAKTDRQEPISPYLLSHIRTLSSLSILVLPHLLALPLLRTVTSPIRRIVADFLPIRDFISADPPTREEKDAIKAHGPRLWRQIVLVLGGLIESVAWLAVWGMTITRAAEGEKGVIDVLSALGMAAVWVSTHSLKEGRPDRARTSGSS